MVYSTSYIIGTNAEKIIEFSYDSVEATKGIGSS